MIMQFAPFQNMLRLRRTARNWYLVPLKRCFRPVRLSLVPSKLLLYLVRNKLLPAWIDNPKPIVWSKRRDRWIKQFDLDHIRSLRTWDYHDLSLEGQSGLNMGTVRTHGLRLHSVTELIVNPVDVSTVSFYDWSDVFYSVSVIRMTDIDVVDIMPCFSRWRFPNLRELYFSHNDYSVSVGTDFYIPSHLQVVDCPDYEAPSLVNLSRLVNSQLLFFRDRNIVWSRKSIYDDVVQTLRTKEKNFIDIN